MKVSRQTKLLEIIESTPIETQEELGEKLRECGYDVTQATISRDIKELKIIKVLGENGKYYYAPFREQNNEINQRIVNVFRESVIKVDYSGNMIVIKTLPGTAMAASAAIDALEWAEVVGCVAGDDTIFVLARSESLVQELVNRYKRMMKR